MSKAFVFPITPKNSAPEEGGYVHQSSPSWVVTFVRWEFRDTFRTHVSKPTTVRAPMVIENDCLSVDVSVSKETLTPSVRAVFVETDVNYEAALEPGDFMFVNMLNWPRDSRRVADQARAQQPINGVKDGFKGVFKVQSVRKTISVDPTTGIKTVLFNIDGFAFTEFNNTIYFNPNLINTKNLQNQALFIGDISTAWASMVAKEGVPYIQEVIAFLIQNFIGNALNPKADNPLGLAETPNVHFLVPSLVGRLLGNTNSSKENSKDLKATIAAKDIYQYLFGIQQYSNNSKQTLAVGMNPSNLRREQKYPNFSYTSKECEGNSLLKPEYWNQVKAWSILNQYTNSPLNELFTCFRVSKAGRIMPTMIFRQIPFTSEDFATQKFGVITDGKANNIFVTKFLNLPRWKIDSSCILNMNIGKDEAARINFVQYYAKSNFSDKGIEIAQETLNNFVFDGDDIKRSGLRPYIVQNQFDDLPNTEVQSAPNWARIIADALIGGHLKLNGTIQCMGIVEPIAVGDNLELDSVVYHIEQVSHSCAINPGSGVKTFRTILSLSHGVSANSNASGTKYAQMTRTDAYVDRSYDYGHQQILPGVSESQDTVYRPDNLDQPHSGGIPFPQPSTKKNVPNKGE